MKHDVVKACEDLEKVAHNFRIFRKNSHTILSAVATIRAKVYELDQNLGKVLRDIFGSAQTRRNYEDDDLAVEAARKKLRDREALVKVAKAAVKAEDLITAWINGPRFKDVKFEDGNPPALKALRESLFALPEGWDR